MTGSDVFWLSQDLWKGTQFDYSIAQRDRQYGWAVLDDFKTFSSTIAVTSNKRYWTSEGNQYVSYESVGGTGTSGANVTKDNAAYTVPTGMPIFTPFGGNSPMGAPVGLTGTTLYAAGAVLPTPGQVTLGASSTNAEDGAILVLGDDVGTTAQMPFVPYLGSANQPGSVLVFECRVKLSSLVTNAQNSLFLGLMGGAAANTAVTPAFGASGIPLAYGSGSSTLFSTTPSLLGFGWQSTGTDKHMYTVHNVQGGTASVTDLMNMATQQIAGQYVFTPDGTTLTRNAYVKLGFRVDLYTGIFTPYLNGFPFNGNYLPNKAITGLNAVAPTPSDSTTANWPNTPMTLCAAVGQYANGTILTLEMDWWACAQTQG
jgi:hypothetical protein